jgi:hypothetical protein
LLDVERARVQDVQRGAEDMDAEVAKAEQELAHLCGELSRQTSGMCCSCLRLVQILSFLELDRFHESSRSADKATEETLEFYRNVLGIHFSKIKSLIVFSVALVSFTCNCHCFVYSLATPDSAADEELLKITFTKIDSTDPSKEFMIAVTSSAPHERLIPLLFPSVPPFIIFPSVLFCTSTK